MVYKVFITEPARQDAQKYARYILEESRSPAVAQRWLDGLKEAAETLSALPERYPFIPEADALRLPLRSFNYHSHRIIYRVEESGGAVYILRIYHGARKPLSRKDL